MIASLCVGGAFVFERTQMEFSVIWFNQMELWLNFHLSGFVCDVFISQTQFDFRKPEKEYQETSNDL